MILHQAYLHIFDKNSGNLLLSQKELPLSNPYITEYFTKIIEKTLKMYCTPKVRHKKSNFWGVF